MLAFALAAEARPVPTGASPAAVTERISVDSQGGQADGASFAPTISGDGRYVAFTSSATNLVQGDTNDLTDIFRRNVVTGETLRVSENSVGGGGDAASFGQDVSDDGQFVVFESRATNLLASAFTSTLFGIFLQRSLNEPDEGGINIISVNSEGVPANDDSTCPQAAENADGRVVAFYSDATNLVDDVGPGIYVKNLKTDEAWHLNDEPDSCYLKLSAGGRWLAYSKAGKVFRWDLETGEVTETPGSTGGQGGRAGVAGVEPDGASSEPAISGDGRYVAFRSFATNLVPGDTNGDSDVFVHDRQTGGTTRVSVSSAGVEGNDSSSAPAISGDGRYVSFSSSASNLVPGDTNGFIDVFVHDRQTGETTRVSVSSGGGESDAHSFESAISANGLVVAFSTKATNLVPGDTNGESDVFIHGILPEGVEATWGDNNCSGSADPIDSLLTLRFDAGLGTNTNDCPDFGQVVEVAFASPHPWGDVDCGGDVNPVDSLKLLRFDAGLGVTQPEGCPAMGSAVTIVES